MRFSSPVFFLFLACVVLVLWLLPGRARKWWLLFASYVFYGSWHYPYLLLLIGCATLNFLGAKWIVGATDRVRRGRWVLAANVLLLVTFKYLDWLVSNVNGVASLFAIDWDLPLPGWVLPLGISFYVFEAISYQMDVIRKRERLHSFWNLQLFFAFFPKLIAGPILRAKELLPQIERPDSKLTCAMVLEAVWLLTTGLFIKTVLADGLANGVDEAFARPHAGLGFTDVCLMGAAFGLQIYFDFSSYTRMALGAALLCGIRLVENFNYPYTATSPVDFWNRWHMSLSRWIRDYVFFPILGKKTTLPAMMKAAIFSMTLCGIWHGAGWNFLLWGFYHGLLIAGYHLITYRDRKTEVPAQNPARQAITKLLAVPLTFALVCLGWLMFRASSLEQALGLIQIIASPLVHRYRTLSGNFYLQVAALIAAVWLAPVAARLCQKLVAAAEPRPLADLAVSAGRGVLVGGMLVASLIYLRGQTAFIYFQF